MESGVKRYFMFQKLAQTIAEIRRCFYLSENVMKNSRTVAPTSLLHPLETTEDLDEAYAKVQSTKQLHTTENL